VTGKFPCRFVRCSNIIAELAGTSKKPRPRPIAAPPNVAAGTVDTQTTAKRMQQGSTVRGSLGVSGDVPLVEQSSPHLDIRLHS
jgi:hypothetical protein